MPAELTDAPASKPAPRGKLWGRPRGWLIVCHGCRQVAERFKPGLCWLCVASADPHADPATGEPLEPTEAA